MRRRPWLAGILLACTMTIVGSAGAQTPSPDALAAARELIEVTRSADQFKALLPVVAKSIKPAIVQGRSEIERDYDAIMPLVLERMNARTGEIIEQLATLYANNFTADELREGAAFYRKPTGQKFLAKLPQIFQESMALGQKFGQSVAAEVHNRMIEELRKRGHNI